MILVDTNIFVDLWTADPKWGEWSSEAVARSVARDSLAINPVIYAELCLGFEEDRDLDRVLAAADVRRLPLPYTAAWPASKAFAAYRRRGGRRSAPLPDFFIGAHAQVEGLPLLTRDTARYKTYFPAVRLIAPD